ncbi:MAG: DNA alkylation repair protein [Gemmatimonadales bacterium]
MNADVFLKRLKALRSPAVAKSHGHLASNEDDAILGIRMGQVFALAKEFMDMPTWTKWKRCLKVPFHEMRVGAVSIMDFQARSKKTTEVRRKELFNLVHPPP